jgi:hypothetical protein
VDDTPNLPARLQALAPAKPSRGLPAAFRVLGSGRCHEDAIAAEASLVRGIRRAASLRLGYDRPPEATLPSPLDLDVAADQAIAACGGDAREAVKALLVANDFLEAQLDELQSKISAGYARGRLPRARDRKD